MLWSTFCRLVVSPINLHEWHSFCWKAVLRSSRRPLDSGFMPTFVQD